MLAILRIEIEDALAAPATAEPTIAAIGAGVLGRQALLWAVAGLLAALSPALQSGT